MTKSQTLRAWLFIFICLPGNFSAAAGNPVRSIGTDSTTGGARAVVVDENAALAHTTQVFPRRQNGPAGIETNALLQTTMVLDELDAALRSVGSKLAEVVKLNVYLAKDDLLPEVRATIVKRFSKGSKPAISYVSGTLAEPGAFVAMDAVATCWPLGPAVMRRSAPDKAGFFSVKVLAGGSPKLFISGMADTNSLLPATQRTLEKLIDALEHLGSKSEDVLQLKVFMQPISEAAAVRSVIAKFFKGEPPPISLVEWISSNPVVEIELIARAQYEFHQEADTVSYLTPPGTTGSKVYSRVARANRGKLIYFPGLYGMKETDGAGQVQEIFTGLGEIAKDAGTDFEHLVKATYYVTDNDASNKLNDLRPKYYNPERPPAASKAKVKGVGIPGRTITMDMIAVTK
jgi:enamine deaminase RidA (YjgF/YER057c/UK114 family)